VRNGKRLTLNAPASPAPRAPADPREITNISPLQGVHVVTLSPAQAQDLGVDPFLTGAIIDQLNGAGLAARVGFRPGDVIYAVNGEPVRSSADLDRLMKSGARAWRIGVQRGGEKNEIQVQL
jgi:S1-C subfamily serine protease